MRGTGLPELIMHLSFVDGLLGGTNESRKRSVGTIRAEGISRRDFMKYCTTLTATMGLSSAYVSKVAAALASAPRPPVIWLALAECTGCAESYSANHVSMDRRR